ncbi:hypothetical protein HK103_002147 [Boothiomyces macroporosus]|uniref:Uncharacterized protein n=1 Tax=Boothiomyces macroporosus TaxID=261099 RepID=A0AAD5UM29_9FUNG|nr:hypothetical protein HK103_002147 [Boothiomyces macroporosus]
MALFISFIAGLVAAQKSNATATLNTTVSSNSSTTVGGSTIPFNTTQTIPTSNSFNQTQAFNSLSPQCQAAVKKYNGTTPQGCTDIPQQSTNFNIDANELNSLNTKELDGICVPACQSSVKQMASEISTACKNDSPDYQYLSAYMTAYFDVLCVKDGSQYCISEEIQGTVSALQQGKSPIELISNTTFACTKCFYQQLTALDTDITAFPNITQQTYKTYSSIIQGECASQFKAFASSAATYSSITLLGFVISLL